MKNPLIVLGITGAIGAGKTGISRMLQRFGAFTSHSDEIVAHLYKQGFIQKKIASLLPRNFRLVTRSKVAAYIIHHPEILKDLEEILHPAVKAVHLKDIDRAREKKYSFAVLDIPLLFECGWQDICDYVGLVTCHSQLQLERAMKRPGMTPEKFQRLVDRQWPLEQKKKLSDFIIDTSQGRLHTFQQLKYLLKQQCSTLKTSEEKNAGNCS